MTDRSAPVTGADAGQELGPCDPRRYGAVGDGITDDTAAIDAGGAWRQAHQTDPLPAPAGPTTPDD